jgi:hypothetical protein
MEQTLCLRYEKLYPRVRPERCRTHEIPRTRLRLVTRQTAKKVKRREAHGSCEPLCENAGEVKNNNLGLNLFTDEAREVVQPQAQRDHDTSRAHTHWYNGSTRPR